MHLRDARLSRAPLIDVRNRITQPRSRAQPRVTSACMKFALSGTRFLATRQSSEPTPTAAARAMGQTIHATQQSLSILRRRFDVAMHARLFRSAMHCGQSESSTPLIQPRLCDRRLPCANFLTRRIWWAPSADGLSPKHLATGGRSPPHDAKPSALVHPHWMLCGPAHTEQGVL